MAHYAILPKDFVLTPIRIPDHVGILSVPDSDLPAAWNSPSIAAFTQNMGMRCFPNTAVLRVPSAIVVAEHNYVLNPAHAEFQEIQFLNSEPFAFDSRLRQGAETRPEPDLNVEPGDTAGNTMSELDTESPARSGLQRIEATVRASETVRQIMAYAGQDRHETESINLAELIREIMPLLRVCMPKNLSIDLRLPDDLPLIQANAAQIRQMVMNLVLNAVEAVGVGQGVILVAARRYSCSNRTSKDYVQLDITDTGRGMAPEVREQIFDLFFTTKLEGRGLGLSVVRAIVTSHGGSIRVASTPGAGTTFEILLPCTEVTGFPQVRQV
jgi:signal transduction histidine kinase